MTGRTRAGSQDPTKNNITIEELKEALSTQRNEIIESFKTEINALKEVIGKQDKIIDNLQNKLGKQAIIIDKLDNLSRKDFAIVYGLPENDDGSNDLSVLDQVENIDDTFLPFRIGKISNNKIRPLKIKFKDEKSKIKGIDKFRIISRDNPELKDIFMNYDQSELTRSEYTRLRNKKKTLVNENPGKTVHLRKGQLRLNDAIIDYFDIRNQVF